MALRRFLEAAITSGAVAVFGDGRQTRDFTYVSDAVSAIISVLEAPLRAEVLNMGGGSRVIVNDANALAERVTGGQVNVVRNPPESGRSGIPVPIAHALRGCLATAPAWTSRPGSLRKPNG